MIALRTVDMRNGFKKVSDLVKSGETVLIFRPHNENMVLLSEQEYNDLDKARNNIKYLSSIKKSRKELSEGKTISFTVDELEAMEDMTADEMRSIVSQNHVKDIMTIELKQ